MVWECDDPDELTGAVVRREVELRLELSPGDLGHLRRKIMQTAADAADTWAEHTDVRDAAEDSDDSDQPAKVE